MPLGAHKAAIMGVAGVSTADVVLIQSQTASDSATISFTSGIDSTYKEYIFGLYKIHARVDRPVFGFQVNVAGESGYNETITSTGFRGHHTEDGSEGLLQYLSAMDQAQGTDFQQLNNDNCNDADGASALVLHLFNPSGTTYAKHFMSRAVNNGHHPNHQDIFMSGYINATGAIDEVQFKMSSGNFDGVIKLWGVK